MSTTAAHPRIRARRIEVQRDEGRRRLRRLVVAGVVVGTLAALWGLSMTPLLDVDHIRVTGATSTGPEAVAAATGIELGDALVTTPLGAAADRVARLPWVETVDVSRRWPGTIQVEVVERRPVAAVPAKAGGWVLLDAAGRQLAVRPELPPGLLKVELAAVDAVPGQVVAADASPVLELAVSRPQALRDRLLALRPAAGGTVEGTVAVGPDREATVVFGAPTQATAKWLALVSILDGIDPTGLSRIDVRVPSAPALTRR